MKKKSSKLRRNENKKLKLKKNKMFKFQVLLVVVACLATFTYGASPLCKSYGDHNCKLL